MKLDYDTVMARADFVYSEMREEEGRPQWSGYGIESSQVKALARALVDEINEMLESNDLST